MRVMRAEGCPSTQDCPEFHILKTCLSAEDMPYGTNIHTQEERKADSFDLVLEAWGIPDVDLKIFREIFGDTPFFSAGGWSDKNAWGIIEEGTYDALAIGRLFLSTPDMVER